MNKFILNKRIISIFSIILILVLITSSLCLFINSNNVVADSNRYIYDGNNLDTNKYKDLKSRIDALKKAHPNWKFQIMETGLDWNYTIDREFGFSGSSPYSLTQNRGSWVDPALGTKSYDNGSWFHASESAIKYVMDPRNWLQDNYKVFQFMSLDNYVESTDKNIYDSLSGTFLYKMQYATEINNACRNKNVNPYFVVARIIQEQGHKGGSTWRMYDSETNSYFYNLFNIGAHGNGNSVIVSNALAKAKENGWDNIEKSIAGGVDFLFNNYVSVKQNTLYLQKFDVESKGGCYTHQYMQNINAPESEAKSMYQKLSKLGNDVINRGFTFVIPVFNNMPDYACAEPDTVATIETMNVKTSVEFRLREGRSTSTRTICFIEKDDTVLSDISYSDGWHRVVLTNGKAGYVYFNYRWSVVDDVRNCNESKFVNSDNVSLYAGPGTSEPLIGTLSKNQLVTRVENSGMYNFDGNIWDRVVLNDGRKGFINRKYLSDKTSENTNTNNNNNNNTNNPTTSEEMVVQTASGNRLIMRDAPNGNDINYSLGCGLHVTRIEKGTSLVNNHYWDKIKTPAGMIGYVAQDCLKTVSNNNSNSNTNTNNSNNDSVTSGDSNSKIDGNTIKMTPSVTVESLKLTYGNNISVKKTDGSSISSGLVGTGYKVTVKGKEYTAIKKGDVNGDGKVTTTDYVCIKNYIMGSKNLNEYESNAADVNNDGKVKTTDYVKIKNYIMNSENISI